MGVSYNISVIPTTDPQHPFRQGDFANIVEALEYAAQTNAGFNFFNSSGQLSDKITYQFLQKAAVEVAQYLTALGFKPYDRVLIIAETSPRFLILFFACQYARLIACPIPFSQVPGSIEAYSKRLSHLINHSASVAIFSPADALQTLSKLTFPEHVSVYDFQSLIAQAKENSSVTESINLCAFSDEDPAFIQYSSGSTAAPKGIQLTQKALGISIHTVLKYGVDLQPDDRTFCWLPYHHSFGLIGCVLSSIYGQRTVDFISPQTFVQDPLLWFKLMTVYRTRISMSPFFGYQLVLKAYLEAEHKPALDLSSLRITTIAGDMINIDALEFFRDTFSAAGFQYKVFCPCYGLTETTMSVAGGETDQEPYAKVLQGSLSQKKIASCGRVLPGCQIKIIDPKTKVTAADKIIGQIWVNGDTVFKSYVDSEQEMTLDSEGFLYTGDLGYFDNGHLFITGREKDMIIIRGRNIWSLDVEWTVQEEIPQLRGNHIAAVSMTNDDLEETLFIVVSLSGITWTTTPESLIKTIQKIIRKASEVIPEVIIIHDPLPLTSSGKIARMKIKQNLLDSKLSPI